MVDRVFEGRVIRVIELDDATADEYVLEFIDPDVSANDAVLAVFIRGAQWSNARVTISPKADSLPVGFVLWALGLAHTLIGDRQGPS